MNNKNEPPARMLYILVASGTITIMQFGVALSPVLSKNIV